MEFIIGVSANAWLVVRGLSSYTAVLSSQVSIPALSSPALSAVSCHAIASSAIPSNLRLQWSLQENVRWQKISSFLHISQYIFWCILPMVDLPNVISEHINLCKWSKLSICRDIHDDK